MPPENNVVPNVVSQPSAPVKIGKFKASKTIVMESWAILMKDKEIMWFPIFSTVCTILAVLILGYIFFIIILGGHLAGFNPDNKTQFGNVVTYVTLFIYYVVIYFIVNFFEAGLYLVVQGRFTGQNLGFSDGLKGAKKFAGKIFIWSLISATVGVILQIISDKSKLIGKIVAGLLGAAWNILTFFSLPSLIIGNFGVKDSFKESASIIRKTWGETFIILFGVGLFFGLLSFILFALIIGIIIICQSTFITILALISFVVIMIAMSIISTTLNSIFKLALYNYAKTGQVPQGFSVEIINGAIKKV